MATIDENIALIKKAVDSAAAQYLDPNSKDQAAALDALVDLWGGFCKNIETIARYTAQPPKA
jgi:hypothetical protein